MYTLEGVSSVANFITAYKESQCIFLSVVCSLFPKAIFLTFFKICSLRKSSAFFWYNSYDGTFHSFATSIIAENLEMYYFKRRRNNVTNTFVYLLHFN